MLTIQMLQDYLAHIHTESDDTGLFMKLVEEIGEVAECLNMRDGRKSGGPDKAALANELADVVHFVVALAAINEIPLEETILQKDERASIKYHHISLKQYLAQKKE